MAKDKGAVEVVTVPAARAALGDAIEKAISARVYAKGAEAETAADLAVIDATDAFMSAVIRATPSYHLDMAKAYQGEAEMLRARERAAVATAQREALTEAALVCKGHASAKMAEADIRSRIAGKVAK
jgi:hypothetical protein